MLLLTGHKDQTVKMFGESRDACRWVRLLGVQQDHMGKKNLNYKTWPGRSLTSEVAKITRK